MMAQGDTVRTGSPKITSLWWNGFPSSACRLVSLQLPLELLQRIFLLLADLYPHHLSSRPDWIAITYVCRYWRSAALGLRELWTHITRSLSISWSQAMMERSAPLPMHIDRHIDASFPDGVEALAASGLLSSSRIRSLRLFGRPRAADILKVLNRLCSPSPLESLSLCVSGMVEPVDLPETLCERDMPHFRRLTFEATKCIRAPLWLLASVTHFTIGASISLRDLLGTLQAMPQLEVLRVAYIFNEWEYIIDAPRELSLARVALPRLSLLSVREEYPHCLLILSSRIDAPSTLRRHLFWRSINVRGWDPAIFTALQALVPRDSAPGMNDGGLRAAQVTGGPECGSFEAWSRTGAEKMIADAGASAREDALFLFHLAWRRVHDLTNNTDRPFNENCPFFYLASLSAHLQTTRIEDLTVAHEASSAVERETPDVQDMPDVGAKWQALLAALPSVKTLRLHRASSACVEVLSALAASCDLLPHLQKIFVVKSTVRYAAGSAARGGGVDIADSDAMASRKLVQENVGADLVEAVSVRSGLEVVLVGCEVDEEALEALRKRARVDFVSEWEYMQSVHITWE